MRGLREARSAHSLRGRLLAAMLAVFALGLGASLISYRLEVHAVGRDLQKRTLQAQAEALVAALRSGAGGIALDLPADWAQAYRERPANFAYTIYGPEGGARLRSPNLGSPLPRIALPPGQKLAPLTFLGVGPDRRAAIAAAGPGDTLIVAARRDMAQDALIDSLFAEDSEQLFIMLPFVLAAILLIWLISGWSLRPIARASREASGVGPRRPDLRIGTRALPREILPLVEAVNGALERLSRAYATERQLTADAAHELRTPLAVLTLRLQRARVSGRIDWPILERELAQMARLVDQLMDLTRKEALERAPDAARLPEINLSRIVREAAAMVGPLIEAKGRALTVTVPETALVRGRADDLRDMVRNLLDNALTHGKGQVGIALAQVPGPAPRLAIEIRDEGPGVPEGEEETVFERFRKLAADTPGSGLGLAIVRQVARSHGGEARFVPGQGLVRVTLPAVVAKTSD